jgi:hypothetical protein
MSMGVERVLIIAELPACKPLTISQAAALNNCQ